MTLNETTFMYYTMQSRLFSLTKEREILLFVVVAVIAAVVYVVVAVNAPLLFHQGKISWSGIERMLSRVRPMTLILHASKHFF